MHSHTFAYILLLHREECVRRLKNGMDEEWGHVCRPEQAPVEPAPRAPAPARPAPARPAPSTSTALSASSASTPPIQSHAFSYILMHSHTLSLIHI